MKKTSMAFLFLIFGTVYAMEVEEDFQIITPTNVTVLITEYLDERLTNIKNILEAILKNRRPGFFESWESFRKSVLAPEVIQLEDYQKSLEDLEKLINNKENPLPEKELLGIKAALERSLRQINDTLALDATASKLIEIAQQNPSSASFKEKFEEQFLLNLANPKLIQQWKMEKDLEKKALILNEIKKMYPRAYEFLEINKDDRNKITPEKIELQKQAIFKKTGPENKAAREAESLLRNEFLKFFYDQYLDIEEKKLNAFQLPNVDNKLWQALEFSNEFTVNELIPYKLNLTHLINLINGKLGKHISNGH